MSTYNWQNAALTRVVELINLARGWDGYDGKRVQPVTAWFVLAMLEDIMEPGTPEPYIVPCDKGFIQVEWHIGDTDIELFVTAPNKVQPYRWHPDDERQDYSTMLTNDFSKVKGWLREAIETAKEGT